MKFGVIYHNYTKNIGDDIQAYAASRFLPQIDYFVPREQLNSFKSENDEPVACIMSAWYMWAKWNWPPAPSIIPKFVGFHYSDTLSGRAGGEPIHMEFMTDLGADYLNAYGPIGCRDKHTADFLNERNVETYFSGCITLTLDAPGPKRKPEREYICLVDIDAKAVEEITNRFKDTDIDIKVVKHNYEAARKEVLWDERKKDVEDLLTLYQNAKCVVTFRLHCLLPCLALRTPVLLMRDSFSSIRLNTYYTWAHYTTPKEFLAGKCSYDLLNPPENPNTYLETRNKLIDNVRSFVEEASKETRPTSDLVKTQYSRMELLEWRNAAMNEALDTWLRSTRRDWKTIAARNKTIAAKNNSIANRAQSIAKKIETIKKLKATNERIKANHAKTRQRLKHAKANQGVWKAIKASLFGGKRKNQPKGK